MNIKILFVIIFLIILINNKYLIKSHPIYKREYENIKKSPTLKILLTIWEEITPKLCTKNTILFNAPKNLFNNHLNNLKIGVCPTKFTIYKIDNKYSPNIFLKGECTNNCGTCTQNSLHECTQISQIITVMDLSTDNNEKFKNITLPIGCICAPKYAKLFKLPRLQYEEESDIINY